MNTQATQTRYSTEEAAARLGIKAQSMRAALCRDGSYCGARPVKTPNRFLRWNADEIEALAAGGSLR
jgi:hypothetical protein